MSATLSLQRVGVAFGGGRRRVQALDDVSFDIQPGRTLGLVGGSGSGKSTTAAVALGLRRPDSGAVEFGGAPMSRRLRDRAGRVGAVLQHPAWSLDPRRRVVDSVAEPLLVAARGGSSARSRRERAEVALADVGLGGHGDRLPHELSGGQRQRVSIARALVTRPEFVVFDEAVSALDVSVQAQVLNLVVDLQAEHGFAALFISHDLAAVRYAAHEIGVLLHGRLVELADTRTLCETPRHPYSRRLLQELIP
ncbi:ATP-binding cassette domain-containing protein [Kineococcus arenarius]|uniref:ATP-binding cassette domain-containing protein n=1 Tax=unclassified Kineococcus TaxID=2621656 RepID=UPI003D7E4535